ncbi:MAG: prenyltransferase [Planctomycetota bacterium]
MPTGRRSSKRQLLAWVVGALVTTGAVMPLSAQSEVRLARIEAETKLGVRRGLDYLARRQNRDGSWTEKIGRKVHDRYEGELGEHVGVTALACMAFLAHGDQPGRGTYGTHIDLGLDFILQSVESNGFIVANRSRMYSHAFATLFLAEVYGMTGRDDVRKKLKLAANLIVQAQNSAGGWRYQPGATDSDMSITVCQVMALRAAKNAGIHVPKETIDGAIAYVKASYVSTGAYLYQHEVDTNGRRQRSRTSFPLTAAGVTALYGAGEYEGEYIRNGLAYMQFSRFNKGQARNSFDYYYGMYYGTQAAFQAGGDYWNEWYLSVWPDILALQGRDGAWTDLVGSNYATAMACVILQIPYQYLPIFER